MFKSIERAFDLTGWQGAATLRTNWLFDGGPMRLFSVLTGGGKVCAILLALALLALPSGARADLPGLSGTLATQIMIAQQEGASGAPDEGAARLMALRAALPSGPDRNLQQAVDHAMLSFFAAGLIASDGAHRRALALFEEAAGEFEALGPGAAAAQVVALDYAAALTGLLSGSEAGYARHLDARAFRDRHALPPDAAAIGALEQAGRLAQAMNDTPALLEELRVTIETAGAIPADDPLLQARAFVHGAFLATVTGFYPVARDYAGYAVISAQQVLFALETGAPGQDRAAQCPALALLLRDVMSLQIDFGGYAEAAQVLNMDIPRLQDACGDMLPGRHATYVNTLGARLSLHAGDPFAAQLRLRAAAAGRSGQGQLSADDALTTDIIRARQAGARLALGFPGEAAALLADVPEGLGLPDTPLHERERLVVQARVDAAQGRIKAALQALDRAEALQRDRQPLHWYPRMAIAYHRALLLLEAGEAKMAVRVRDTFEAELSAFIAEIQASERALDEALAADMLASNSALFGAGFARTLDAQRRDGAFAYTGFRELERLRMLYELAEASFSGDAQVAQAAFDAVPERGLPADTTFAGLAQAAYLRACYVAYGPGLRCEMAASSAMQSPAAVPYACVGGCPSVMSGATDLVISAGMMRRGPLLDRFAEPVLAAQIAAADAARASMTPDPGDDPALAAWRRDSARVLGQFAGAEAAFDMAQRRFEGRAAEAVAQLGARLAAGDDKVARLMRDLDALTDRLDALLRDSTVATAGDIHALTGALNANRDALSALRPDYADLFDPRPLTPGEISELLPDNAAFVMISGTAEATYVFAVRDGDLDWRRAPIGAAALEQKVATLRAALDPLTQDRGAESLLGAARSGGRPFDRGLAHRLYRELLAPLDDMLAGADLHVVADGPLGALPLALLVRAPPAGNDTDPEALRKTDWLVRHHAITMHAAPTGLRLAAVQRQRPAATQAFIGFGDPVFAPRAAPQAAFARLSHLPGTRTEIEQIAALFDTTQTVVHLGAAATKAAVLNADLRDARIVAFATHGLLAGQMAGLAEPGLVFSAPPGAEDDPDASYLTASEAATLDLNADWVLLSACSTAGPDGRPDSRGLSGLARAFLFAGARSILVSHWPVRDDAAMLLTTAALGWQADNPQAPRARAMQHAMLTLIDDRTNPGFAHPSAWAPFILLGDG